MNDIFIRPIETYTRDIRLLETYVEEMTRYLQLQTMRPKDECREFVQQQISAQGQFPIKDPKVFYLERNHLGDRQQTQGTFSEYLAQVVENREILAPTMTSYLPPEKKHSLLAKYIDGNLEKRKKAKKEMFVASMKGDKILEAIKDGEQSSVKIKNNSLSGAHCSPSTILYNKSSHSTLTSICRCASSYGNANNERFLYGNRHYWTPDVVKTNIVSILNHTDLDKVSEIMKKYRLRAPTVEETMGVIIRSTDPYWRLPDQLAIIGSMVKSMSPVERSAYIYTGDFYHLAQFNPEFARTFLKGISTKADVPLTPDQTKDILKQVSSNLIAHISIICTKELDGQMISDAETRPLDYGIIGATAKNIQDTLHHYSDFIQLFWVTDNLPPSIFMLPSIIRRGVITSDTDSTIFTVAPWTMWYRGQLDFEQESLNIASSMVYLAAELIRHILARLSANMGVSKRDLKRLSMKNEYYFPVFVLTSRAKHYFASIAAREGNVYKHLENEIKGVALRNSNVPTDIIDAAKKLMLDIQNAIMRCEKVSIKAILTDIASRENRIREEVESGGYSLMTKMQIKSSDSYKNADRSNYVHYQLWEEVFAPKYGHIEPPPYRAIKVSVDIDTPSKLREWLVKLDDRALAERLESWLDRKKRNHITSFYLPETILMSTGVPKEIVQAIDVRKLIAQIMESFYLILESLGIFMRNDDNTRLVSDHNWQLPLN